MELVKVNNSISTEAKNIHLKSEITTCIVPMVMSIL